MLRGSVCVVRRAGFHIRAADAVPCSGRQTDLEFVAQRDAAIRVQRRMARLPDGQPVDCCVSRAAGGAWVFCVRANLAFVGLGIVSTIAQVYYPKLLSRVLSSKPGDCSRTVELQALSITMALAAVAGLAILRGTDLIGVFFPRYQEAGASTVVLAISCLPLALATWLIPICIATSVSPKRDATRLFVPAYAALVTAMMLGHVLGGTKGLAWGCVLAGLILLSCVLSHLRRNKVLKKNTGTRIGIVQTAIVLGLSILALPILPPARGGLLAVAAQRNVSGPPAGWALAFNEEFDSLRLWDPVAKHGLWEPHYPWGGRNNPSNEELQYYVDPRSGKDPKSISQFHPFSNEHGTLHIRARRLLAGAADANRFPIRLGPSLDRTHVFVHLWLCGNESARSPRSRFMERVLACSSRSILAAGDRHP